MSTVAVLRPEPSPGGATTLAMILAMARARAKRLALWMERVWQSGRSSPDQGGAITVGEVAWPLAADDAAHEEATFLGADPRAAALGRAAVQAPCAPARDRTRATLVNVFSSDDAEADMLALLAAFEADLGLQRVIAYLNDDTRLGGPMPELTARSAGRPRAPRLGEHTRRLRLAAPLDEGPVHAPTTAWRIDPAVMIALHDGVWRDPSIADTTHVIGVDDLNAAPLHAPALAVLGLCEDLTEVELTGPNGIGRQTLAARFAATRGRCLLGANVPTLLGQGLDLRHAIVPVLRQARFSGALAYFRDPDAATGAEWTSARKLGVDFLRGARATTGSEISIGLEPLPQGERLALWRGWTAATTPAALSTHRLTPAEIAALAAARDGATKVRLGGRPDHALLSLLPCPYGWDDLVLPAEVERHLREFADQVRLRWCVYDELGFGRLAHLGYGVAALFGGPSGTGKTMAAQVIARSLGLDLYRVDLAGVVNKYVGETEKRLREVFDACEHSGALLFFDEADALFGGRMQVKDAHDRFANIETNYLLQRIETFDGVAILATNRRNEIDQAFVRRLRFVIDFLPPRPEERLALWRRALRPKSPAGEDLLDEIDWPLLAERLPMTGAEIKNTVLAAAFLAKAAGTRIGMSQILSAARREVGKQNDKLPVSLRDRVER
jgi:ATPase family associated with various cellular activities (AAA)